MDIDDFKKYNDTYGHIAGDNCLKKIGEVLRKSIQRKTDLVARYGGEEIAVIIQETTLGLTELEVVLNFIKFVILFS